MRMVFGLVLLVGFALAAGAVYLVQDYLGQEQMRTQALENERAKVGKLVKVLAAKDVLKYGDTLEPEDVQEIYLQQDFLPEGVFTDAEALFPKDEKPRFILRAMGKFEPILTSKVTEPGETAGLTTRLAAGKRAFAINVDVSSGVSGFVKPDDLVDVYWSGNPGGDVEQITKLIETSVKIIAVDQTADSDSLNAQVARTVTVEVTPQQVARLAQAQSTGSLSLSLVGIDAAAAEVTDVDTNTLLGITEEVVMEAAPEPEQQVCTRRERKGTESIVTQVDCVTGAPLQ